MSHAVCCKTLQGTDTDWLVHFFAPPAITLTRMEADATQNHGKRVLFSDDLPGLFDVALADKGNVSGCILSNGTCRLTWRGTDSLADTRWAMFVINMGLVLMSEIPQSTEYRVWYGLTQTAQGG
jgi:hypothetical protein